MNSEFKASAPNRLWVADFTYVRTAIGFVYVAFIIDIFVRYIVGWKVSSSPNAQMVLDALEQALAAAELLTPLYIRPNSGLSAQLAGLVWTLSTKPSLSVRAKAL